MHRVQRQLRKGTALVTLVRVGAALYCELAVSALQLVPIPRVKALLQTPEARAAHQAWV